MKTEETELQDTVEDVALANGIDEIAFEIYCDNLMITENYEDAVSGFEDAYIGEMSVHEYAEQLAEDMYPDAVATGYFDCDSFARDLELGGEVWEQGGHLFRNY